MNGQSEHKVLFNNNSYLSVGIVVLIIGATIWLRDGQARGESTAQTVRTELSHYREVQNLKDEIINTKIDNLLGLMKIGTDDKFTARDHKMFVERLQELNPNLHVPRATP